ncbi:MAG TPA: hypothetical protein DIT01_19390, partial [Lentisphaeria bacterium]|nr:hypothetical protein [Lentisphaeria bacterium]
MGYEIRQATVNLFRSIINIRVPQDDAEAVKWFRKAAEQGYPQAQYNLGVAYANGEGVPEDDVAAVKWYRKA